MILIEHALRVGDVVNGGDRTMANAERLVQHADLILTMTNGHRAAVAAHWPELAAKTYILSPDGRDVSDPIGGSQDLYRSCAEQIDTALASRLSEIDFDLAE